MILTNVQIRILTVLVEGHDDDRVYFYGQLTKDTGFTREVLRTSMRSMREAGLVQYVRGLIREDEQGYYGSGHMITSAGADAIRRYLPKEEFQGFDMLPTQQTPVISTTTFNWSGFIGGANSVP